MGEEEPGRADKRDGGKGVERTIEGGTTKVGGLSTGKDQRVFCVREGV